MRDWHGQSAADIAETQGHVATAAALRACEVMENDKEYVYDVYSMDVAGLKSKSAHNSKQAVQEVLPVVSVSSTVEKWLMNEAFGDMDSEDRDLQIDSESRDDDGDELFE